MTLRVGISLAPFDGRDPVRLVHAADTAIDSAKHDSHNGFCFYSSDLARAAVDMLAMQNELHAALDRDEFELVYQPLIDIACDRVIAAEALLRWNHPTRGPVSPLEILRDIGSTIVQGYFYCKPVTPEVITRLLEAQAVGAELFALNS